MTALFAADAADALDNTVALAQRCNLELRLGTYYPPAFPVPDDETLDSWIRSQARAGLRSGWQKAPGARQVARRLRRAARPGARRHRQDGLPRLLPDRRRLHQLGQAARHPGRPRGSGAGSLVARALGITDLDPLPYDLLFERFLNPERVSMPDFDIDFCMDGRDEVIDYVARKYGRDRVSQIIAARWRRRRCLRDAGRVLGLSYGFVNDLAKLIPLQPADPLSLDDVLGRSKRSQQKDGYLIAEIMTATKTTTTTSAT